MFKEIWFEIMNLKCRFIFEVRVKFFAKRVCHDFTVCCILKHILFQENSKTLQN